MFLSGPGGVGKSHVIKLIYSETSKTIRHVEPGALLTARTGFAAFNINGLTLHSAFLLGRSKCSGFQPDTLRTKLSRLMFVIIDEKSIVGSTMLLEIHKRLKQIKGIYTR